jgi:hypothetical protein
MKLNPNGLGGRTVRLFTSGHSPSGAPGSYPTRNRRISRDRKQVDPMLAYYAAGQWRPTGIALRALSQETVSVIGDKFYCVEITQTALMTGPTAPDWNFDPARSASWTAIGSHRWRTRDDKTKRSSDPVRDVTGLWSLRAGPAECGNRQRYGRHAQS